MGHWKLWIAIFTAQIRYGSRVSLADIPIGHHKRQIRYGSRVSLAAIPIGHHQVTYDVAAWPIRR
eukprot:scaffold23202_cov83-Skeletonema_dohrnii-CCMP3373.AAC.3